MKRASVTTHEARRVEQGVMEWAKYQLRLVSHLPYREACDASGLRAEDSGVGIMSGGRGRSPPSSLTVEDVTGRRGPPSRLAVEDVRTSRPTVEDKCRGGKMQEAKHEEV